MSCTSSYPHDDCNDVTHKFQALEYERGRLHQRILFLAHEIDLANEENKLLKAEAEQLAEALKKVSDDELCTSRCCCGDRAAIAKAALAAFDGNEKPLHGPGSGWTCNACETR